MQRHGFAGIDELRRSRHQHGGLHAGPGRDVVGDVQARAAQEQIPLPVGGLLPGSTLDRLAVFGREQRYRVAVVHQL